MCKENVLTEVNKVVHGKSVITKKVFMAILAGGHILLEDSPGVGKTTMALAFSKAMDLSFQRIQFTPDVTASDIVGFNYFDKNQNKFVYHEGAIMAHFILGDEINRTTSRTQSALLEAMEESAVTVDSETYKLPQPFVVIATQNPLGSAGTQPLPDAQLDRFMVKLSMGYPDFESQIALLRERQTKKAIDEVQAVLTAEQLVEMKQEVQQVQITDRLLAYITTVTMATRTHPQIIQGISPRGALAVCQMAKANAYLNNRHFVIPEDILAIWEDTCVHRLVTAVNIDAKSVFKEIIQQVQTPDEQLV